MINEQKRELRRQIKEFNFTREDIKKAIERKNGKITFLEGLYQSGAKYLFSEEFRNEAIKERQKECIKSSALHTVFREDFGGTK